MPDRIHAKMRPYDMKDKFDPVQMLRNWRDIPTHNKTYESLAFVCDKIENAIHNKNMDLAKTWLEKVYVRLQEISAKRPISETEFTKYLNDKNKALKFARRLGKTAKAAAAVMKYEGVITKSITLIKDIYKLYWEKDKTDYNESLSKLAKNRNELKKGYEKMKIVMDCINVLGECAPSGISEMIEFNVEVFKAGEKTIKFASDYAEKIEELAEGSSKSAREKCYGKGSFFTSGEEVSKSNDLQDSLDRKFKNKRYRNW
jgi:pyruvate-formate lyase